MDLGNHVFEFENGLIVDMNDYPPAPIAWIYNTVDLFCDGVYPVCPNWRSYFDIPEDSWFSEKFKTPSVHSSIPKLLSYTDFRDAELSSGNDPAMQQQPYYSLDAIGRYAFQTSNTELGNIGTPTACFASMMLVLLFGFIKKLCMPRFSALGRTAALHTHGKQWVMENQVRITKFGEYVFRLLYHTSISFYGIYYFHDKEWWQPGRTHVVFQGFPYHEILPGMAWYYLLQMAYNLDAFFSLLVLSLEVEFRSLLVASTLDQQGTHGGIHDVRIQSPIVIRWSKDVRGDFQEMLTHHVATNLLIFVSSYQNFTRIGSMIFLIHDISDVPVDLSKLANFLKWKRTTIVCFALMTFTWMYTRLYILPCTIYWTMLTKRQYVFEFGVSPVFYAGYRHFFYFFTGLLICLHFAWFLMFMRILYTLIVKYEVHDYSEHKGGESMVNGAKKGL